MAKVFRDVRRCLFSTLSWLSWYTPATLFTWGEEYLKNSDAVYGVQCNDLAKEIGFRNGDKIISFDGNEVVKFHELQVILARNQAKSATVIRDGEQITVNIGEEFLPAILSTPGMFTLRVPFQILSVPDSSLNAAAGLLAGDRIVAIDSTEAFIIQDVQSLLSQHAGGVCRLLDKTWRQYNYQKVCK